MIITKFVKIDIQQPISVICDNPNCKREILLEQHEWGAYGSIKVNFPYGSKFDNEHWYGHLCDDCMEKILGFLQNHKKAPNQLEFEHSIETKNTPAKCVGCDCWDDMSGTPDHCRVEKCIKESKRENKTVYCPTCKHWTLPPPCLIKTCPYSFMSKTEIEAEQKMFAEMETVYQEKQRTKPIRRT